jgi:hypothetical protein
MAARGGTAPARRVINPADESILGEAYLNTRFVSRAGL